MTKDDRIAQLQNKVTQLDGQLGSRNLTKEAEYLTKLTQLQLDNNKLRMALEACTHPFNTSEVIRIAKEALSITTQPEPDISHSCRSDGVCKCEQPTQEPVYTNGDRTMTMEDRNFTSEGGGYIQDNNFDFDAGLRIDGDFVDAERDQYAQMLCNVLNANQVVLNNRTVKKPLSDEEIIEIKFKEGLGNWFNFARAIEKRIRTGE